MFIGFGVQGGLRVGFWGFYLPSISAALTVKPRRPARAGVLAPKLRLRTRDLKGKVPGLRA